MNHRWRIVSFVVVTVATTAACLWIGARTNTVLLLALSQAMPGLTALLLCVALPSRRRNVAQLGLHRFGGWRWYGAALALPVLPIALSYGAATLLGLTRFNWPMVNDRPLNAAIRLIVVPLLVLIGPLIWSIGEETGWRGWLQIEATRGRGARGGALLAAGVWAVWHSLYIFGGAYYHAGNVWINAALFTLTVIPMGVVFGWLRLGSASVWPPIVAHAVSNAVWQIWAASFTSVQPVAVYVAGEAGIVNLVAWWALAYWAWRRLGAPAIAARHAPPAIGEPPRLATG